MGWLEHTLKEYLHVNSCSWSFRNLERADLRSITIRDGAAADVIIIAVADVGDVPEHVKRWLEACLQKQRKGRAVLVDLHEEDAAHDGPENVCTFLGGLAERWRTELLCNGALDERMDPNFATKHVERRRQSGQILHSHPEIDECSDPFRWGLNE